MIVCFNNKITQRISVKFGIGGLESCWESLIVIRIGHLHEAHMELLKTGYVCITRYRCRYDLKILL
jgi:hypothetical protein